MSLKLSEIENRIFEGNVIEVLRGFPSECIDCVITSPPYYKLRRYSDDAVLKWEDGEYELGQEKDVNLFVDHLLLVLKEIRRVLKRTGTVFWNMGDSYVNNSSCLVPERFAIRALDEQGWYIRNMLIWEKPLRPSSVKNRFANRYEYVIFMVKDPKNYYFNFKAVAQVERKDRSLGQYAIRMAEKAAGCDLAGLKVKKKRVVRGDLILEDLLCDKDEDKNKNVAQGVDADIERRVLTLKSKLRVFGEKFLSAEICARLDALFGDEWRRWFDGAKDNMWIPNEEEWVGIKQVLGVGETDLDADIRDFSGLTIAMGRNVGDVLWFDAYEDRDINVREEGHFAAFPTALVDYFLRVGCPLEVCEVCGAPKLIELEKVGAVDGEVFLKPSRVKTVATCGCNKGFKRGIVLDPFMGSGTTAAVAKRLGFRWVGVEICRKFIQIAQKRLARTVPFIIDGQS